MGHDLGDFKCLLNGDCHVEYSHSWFNIWNPGESKEFMRLDMNQAEQLINILQFGIDLYGESSE